MPYRRALLVAWVMFAVLGAREASAQTTYLRDFVTSAFGFTGISDVTPDGSYAVVGSSGNRVVILKLDAAGQPVWQRLLGGPDAALTALGPSTVAVTTTRDGGYVVAVAVSPVAGAPGIVAVRFDGSGAVVWQRKYLGAHFQDVRRVVSLADGDLAIVGTIKALESTSVDVLVIRLADSGTVKWQQSYGAPRTDVNEATDVANDAAAAPNGGLFVVGTRARSPPSARPRLMRGSCASTRMGQSSGNGRSEALSMTEGPGCPRRELASSRHLGMGARSSWEEP